MAGTEHRVGVPSAGALEMEAEKLAGPIRRALGATLSGLGFLISVVGSLWQV